MASVFSVGGDDSVAPQTAYPKRESLRRNRRFLRADRGVRPYKLLGTSGRFVGGTNEFAENFRKIGHICRDDVGIVPYA